MPRKPNMPSLETGRIAAVSFGWMWLIAFWLGTTVWLVASVSTGWLCGENLSLHYLFNEAAVPFDFICDQEGRQVLHALLVT